MTDWNAVSAFMAAVVPWPGSAEDPGYVNLHYSMLNPKPTADKPLIKGMGWPFRKLDEFVSRAAWINTTNNFKDAWFCTSLQSDMGTNTKGRPKAVRFAHKALAVKSVWIDVDIGVSEPGKKPKYPDIPTALKAVLAFINKVGLPQPSAIVYSGGGIHFYWISKDRLSVAEWQPYASGLKNLLLANNVLCDTGLTTDVARILRIPGTFNHKPEYGEPRPVTLAAMPLKLYEFEHYLGFVKEFAGPMATVQVNKSVAIFADGVTLATFGKPAFTVDDGTSLQGGITNVDALLDPKPIFKQCGFFKEALLTGGANYDNALWMYSVLGATFMENGNAIAHAVSKGHSSYSEADTQALYDRKVADRADRGIGYPSCATIAGAGCQACATCPLFAAGKSPLNIRPVVTATVTPAMGQTPAARALKLPPDYELNPAGIICRVVEKASKDGEITTSLVPLFDCHLSDFWVQKHPDCLNYTVTVDKGFTHQASVPWSEMSKQGFRAYLGTEPRTLINTVGVNYLENFYLSMMGKLRAEAAAQEAVPFGWYEHGGKVKGFVYGGTVMEDNGVVRPCGIGDPNIKRYYTPHGDIQPWFDAAATVTNRKRPELTAIMLMGFASPLLRLVGKNSVMYSVWGDTGSGKSSAYKVGMAMWGHPLTTKGSENSTRNNITTQMKEIRHLPFYWDEITNDKHRETVAAVMHEASDGTEKGRNLSGQRTQDRGTWKLMICAASNGSYREFIQERNPNHAASLVRVLEWHVAKIDGGPGHMNDADASVLLDALEQNYGAMGLRYGAFLAANHARIAVEAKALCNRVQHDFNGGNAERFWTTSVALMILAARYAKIMGVDVEEADIQTFLYGVLRENIAFRGKAGMANGVVNNTEEALGRYLKERGAEERVLWTNYIHRGQGRAPKPVMILKQLSQQRNTMGGIEIRVAVENREIIIAGKDFDKWLRDNKYSVTQVNQGLEKEFGAMFTDKLRILSGTIYATELREPAIILPVLPTSPLWPYLTEWSSAAEKDALAANVEPEPIETGLTPPEDVIQFTNEAIRG